MIHLEHVTHIIELTLLTANIEDARPLSILLIAKKESAKTETVAEFSENDGVLYLNNFTPTSFMEKHINNFSDGKYHHLIIPDLLNCISRQKYLVDTTITFLNSFTEEGVKEIMSKAFTSGSVVLPKPVRGGVITTIAKEDFEQRWKNWSSVGFLTRFLPITFQYGQDIVDEILWACASEDEVKVLGQKVILRTPSIIGSNKKKKLKVQVPSSIAKQIIPLAENIQTRLSTYGFRSVRHIRRLVQAEALYNNRATVTQEDMGKIKMLSEFFSFNYPVIGNKKPPKFMSDFELQEGWE